ncbi:MAG: hypothetical protein ACLGIF_09735 [Actinomycetes bacterium]
MAGKKIALTVAASAAALGAGLGVAGVASADPTPTPSASPSSSASAAPDSDRRDGGFGRRGHGVGPDTAALAQKLGVAEDKLRDALREIHDENKPTAKPTPGTDRPDPAERDAELAGQLAEKLGLDEAKVKAALDELRTERQQERAEALQSRLDQAVKDGTLTQAEADAVTKAVEKGVIGGGRR